MPTDKYFRNLFLQFCEYLACAHHKKILCCSKTREYYPTDIVQFCCNTAIRHSFIHSAVVLQQVYSLFQSEFSAECDLMLPFQFPLSLFPLALRSSNSYLRLLRLLVTFILLSFLLQRFSEGSSYARCYQ